MRGLCGAHFPATAPSSSLCATCWLVVHCEPMPPGRTAVTRELPEVRREGCYTCANKSARSSTLRSAVYFDFFCLRQILFRGRCLRISLPPTLVADANFILSALIGEPRPPRDRIRPRGRSQHADSGVARAPMCAGSAELRLTLPRGAAARPRFWGEWEVRAEARAETPLHFRTAAGARGWLCPSAGRASSR